MVTLLTCLDPLDPFPPGLSDVAQVSGPTLSLVAELVPGRLAILVTGATPDAGAPLDGELARRYPDLLVERIPVCLSSADIQARLSAILNQLAAAGNLVVCANTGPDAICERWGDLLSAAPRARWVAVHPPSDGMAGRMSVCDEAPAASPRVREAGVAFSASRPAATAATALPVEAVCARMGLRGEDAAFRKALETAAQLAPHSVPVLIQGETGTGKGLLAALLHELSGRGRAPFVAVNCAALPETLVESILYGHRRGAFTGAATDQPGKFTLADGGTLFLDEVGELPHPAQAKLLRVLEDGVVEPLGASKGHAVDVRIVAATHRDLRAAVAARTFREDLFYRLGFAQLILPPLRARAGDIKLLALHHLAQLNRALPVPRRLDATAVKRLEQHAWPGNIRELANVIGRSCLLAPHTVLGADDIRIDPPPAARADPSALPEIGAGFSLETYIADTRRHLVQRALDQSGGNKSKAARLLGISPQAIHAYLKHQA